MLKDADGSVGNDKKSVWNSLEIAKLIVGIATPFMLFLLGQQITNSELARQEKAAQNERSRAETMAQFERVTSKRVELWDELAPKLNDVYAYLLYVGQWKELTAADIVRQKREADKLVHSYRPFFSDEFFSAYNKFMASSFQTYNKMGSDAQPRTTSRYRSDKSKGQVTEIENSDCVFLTYNNLLQVVASDFALKVTHPERRPKTPAEKNTDNDSPSDKSDTILEVDQAISIERCQY